MVVNTIVKGASPVAPGNQGPLISVLTWFLLVTMSLSVIVRLAIKYFMGGLRWREDLTVCLALFFGIGQGVATSIEVTYGLGKYQSTLQDAQVAGVLKSQYAGDLLYIPTLCFAQMGTLQLIEWFAASKTHKRLAQGCQLLTLAYNGAAIVTLAVWGGISRPWNVRSRNSIDLNAFWISISTLSILTESVAIALPLIIVFPLKLNPFKKLGAVSAFCSRMLVIGAIVVRMVYFATLKASTEDITYDLVNLAVATQLVLALAVTTASIPSLKPLLDTFQTGMLEASAYGHGVHGSQMGSSGMRYHLGSLDKSFTHSVTVASGAANGKGAGKVGLSRKASTTTDKRERKARVMSRDRSIDSERSDEMRIVKTAEWSVRHDYIGEERMSRGSSPPAHGSASFGESDHTDHEGREAGMAL